MTYDNPREHIWNKYKNPDSPDFRAELSEDAQTVSRMSASNEGNSPEIQNMEAMRDTLLRNTKNMAGFPEELFYWLVVSL